MGDFLRFLTLKWTPRPFGRASFFAWLSVGVAGPCPAVSTPPPLFPLPISPPTLNSTTASPLHRPSSRHRHHRSDSQDPYSAASNALASAACPAWRGSSESPQKRNTGSRHFRAEP
jgi:hypothetical protein